MELTMDVLINRNTGIGGSDAKRIMDGDWLKLYNEKTGGVEREDLSNVFRAQLGLHTEPFHADWFAMRTGFTVEKMEPQRDAGFPFMFTHPDRWIKEPATFLEMKHSHSRMTLRESAEFYLPQLAHTAQILGVKECWMSVIPGNEEPLFGAIEIDQDYIKTLIEMEAAFWWHVENKIPPEIVPTGKLEAAEKLVLGTKIGGLRRYDFATSNAWAVHANAYWATLQEAERHAKAKLGLKELVPEDASEVVGHGITIKRDKRGYLRMTADGVEE